MLDPKHTLWVFVKTASAKRFYRVPTMYILSKTKKFILKKSAENFQFLQLQQNLHITWGCFRNDTTCACTKLVA